MKFGVVNKSTTVNRFVLHTLQRNITHLAVITPKSNIKFGVLKKGGTGKEPEFLQVNFFCSLCPIFVRCGPKWVDNQLLFHTTKPT